MGNLSSSSIMILMAVKLLLGIVFLGWMLLWVMMPTNTYRNKWSPKITMATSSTYFGRQGTIILLYTFPILLISTAGCVYLHMMKKRSPIVQIKGKLSRCVESWKKPVIVKGPMGIFTAMELAFCLMFLAMIVWALSLYQNNSFAPMTKESAEEEGLKV